MGLYFGTGPQFVLGKGKETVAFLVLTLLLGARLAPGADEEFFRALEGDNRHVGANYALEIFSLSTPMIEGGVATTRCLMGRIRGDRRAWERGILTATALAGTQALSVSLKYLIRRERPVRHRYRPRLWNTRHTPSFPSGHAASSAALATLLISEYPRYRLPLIAYAALSGYAQVYTGNHYPSDVLGGWTLGYVVARLAIRYDRAIQKHCSWLSQTVVFRTREGWGVGWVCGPVSAP